MQKSSEQILTEWLVLAAQNGASTAVEQLLRLWYPKFLRYATHQVRDKDAAQDVVQETLITIAKTISRLKDPEAFPKWAYQILHRRGIDHQRKEQRRRTVTDNIVESNVTQSPFNTDDDLPGHVRQVMMELEENSYNVIHLHYLHGMSVQEISAICEVPSGTVKSRLHTARNKLRTLLETNQ